MQIGEGMSVPLLATWPAMEEREKEGHLMRKSVESWNLGESQSLWRKEGKREKGKKEKN